MVGVKMEVKKIGVIGAGQMGSGIAHVCALAGFDVKLNDVSRERIESGLATINGNLARQVNSERITEKERDASLARIEIAEQLDHLEPLGTAKLSSALTHPPPRRSC